MGKDTPTSLYDASFYQKLEEFEWPAIFIWIFCEQIPKNKTTVNV